MATRRFGISSGEVGNQVTEAVGAAVVADGIELTVDLAAIPAGAEGRLAVLNAVEHLENYIKTVNWPPA